MPVSKKSKRNPSVRVPNKSKNLDAPSPQPQLVTETKFRQQYPIAAAVHGGDIVAIRNGSGNVEAFTVGADGTVWNFYPNPESDTGYSRVSTGLVAKSVVAGRDADGRLILFAANNLVLNYVKEAGNTAGHRWGTILSATIPQPPSAIAIAGLYLGQINGSLYVGVLTEFRSATPVGVAYAFSYGIWDNQAPVFTLTRMTLSTLNCVWSGSSANTAAFTCLDQTYIQYNIGTQLVQRYPFASVFNSLSVTTVLDSAANNRYFAILSDGNLYQMIGGDRGSPYSWAQITQGMSFRTVESIVAETGEIHLFVLGANANLFHFQPFPESRSGWTDPIVIQQDVALLGVASLDQGNVELFTVGNAPGSLSHLIFQVESGNWQHVTVEVPTSGPDNQ